jgi:hypothetical protein
MRRCEERSDEAIQAAPRHGLLRGACHRGGHCGPDPLARNTAVAGEQSVRGRHGKYRGPLSFLRGPSRAAAVLRPRCFSWRYRGRPRHGEHSLFLSRRPVMVARHRYRCRGAPPALRWRRFPDHTAAARSGIVGLSRDLGQCRTNDLGSALLRTARSHARRAAARCRRPVASVLARQPRPQPVRRKAGVISWARPYPEPRHYSRHKSGYRMV